MRELKYKHFNKYDCRIFLVFQIDLENIYFMQKT